MMISDDHMEWASVRRMREMLIDVHDDYKVTHSYALFTTILCWVMQSIRSNGHTYADAQARAVFEALQQESIADPPWEVWTAGDRAAPRSVHGPFEGFHDFNAARFLTALRNAAAHGDARKIRPVNRGGILVGHEFQCSEKNRSGGVTWESSIILERSDMRRIGVALADRFCAALASDHEEVDQAGFESEAKRIREAA